MFVFSTFAKIFDMHKGFELFINSSAFNAGHYKRYLALGRERYDSVKTNVEDTINSFVLQNGKIDGSKMQANWFPQLEADIFISHSHIDEGLAIALSEWLYSVFGLSVFIDSCVWGYADRLLKLIDDEYCLNQGGQTYSYTKRNYSTSHVHMMLSTALTMMIDKAECILFLNTPNSITPYDVVSKTKSPWIYSEIAMTNLVRQKPVEEYRLERIVESYSEGGEIRKGLDVEYIVNTEHLTKIDVDDLSTWNTSWQFKGNKYSDDYMQHALDILYYITSNN